MTTKRCIPKMALASETDVLFVFVYLKWHRRAKRAFFVCVPKMSSARRRRAFVFVCVPKMASASEASDCFVCVPKMASASEASDFVLFVYLKWHRRAKRAIVLFVYLKWHLSARARSSARAKILKMFSRRKAILVSL